MDWFHSEVTSVCKNTGFYRNHRMHTRCLQERCADIGIPDSIKSNGNPTLHSEPVKQFLNQHVIRHKQSESENQQQNPAEHGGGTITCKLKRVHWHTNFDLQYWDYSIEILWYIANRMANPRLSNWPPVEHMYSVLTDISYFQYHFWQHLWYWDPHIKWPSHQWRKEHYLGHCRNFDDPFTYCILPEWDNNLPWCLKHLAASFVHPILDENEQPPCVNDYVDLPIANIHHPSGNVATTPLPTINEEENDMEIDDNAEWSSPLITALSESNAIQDLCLNILTLKMKSLL